MEKKIKSVIRSIVKEEMTNMIPTKKHDNEAYKEEKLIPKTYFPNIRI